MNFYFLLKAKSLPVGLCYGNYKSKEILKAESGKMEEGWKVVNGCKSATVYERFEAILLNRVKLGSSLPVGMCWGNRMIMKIKREILKVRFWKKIGGKIYR